MKKFTILLLLLVCLALPALCENNVVDEANLLTREQEAALQGEIDAISGEYDLHLLLLTKSSIGRKTPMLYAADYYDERFGKDTDGLIFLISMADRDYCTVTSGKAIRAFTDWGIDRIHDYILPDLRDGNYAAAMEKWLGSIPTYMEQYASGRAYDDPSLYGSPAPPKLKTPMERLASAAPVILCVSLLIAFISVMVMKSGMKTNRRQSGADSYVRDFQLTRVQDIYLYTSTVRRRIETNTSGGHGGGHGGSTTFHSSSGGTHGGRGGKF